MSNYSPTIVSASLSDQDLKDSIDKLVRRVDEQSLKMAQNFDAAVQLMKESLQSLDKVKVSFGKNVESGTASRTKSQKEEISSTDKLIDKNKELASSYERVSQAKSKKPNYTSIQSDVDKSLTYLVNTNKDVDRQLEQIIQNEQRLVAEKQKEAQVTKEIATEQAKINGKYAFGNSSDQAGREEQQRQRLEQYKRALQEATSSYKTMQQVIANALHIGAEEVHNYDVRTASARQLNAMLKQQRDAYSRLNDLQRVSSGGMALRNSIQETQRALQKLQSMAARPVSLRAALSGSEKTLDDIVYKIRRLQSYMQGLDVTNSKSAEEFRKAALNVEILKNKQNELLQKNSQLIASNNNLIKSNTALGRSWNYMKNRLAFYFTVGASTQFVKNLIDIRSQYEMNERALGILINSAERGTQIFNELSKMALVSPYTLIELSSAAKQLVAYDIAAKDVVDTTRRLADMASAVGVPMERLTYALGQIKAYGYLNSRDQRMFANAGIPLAKQLSEYYTEIEGKLISTGDVYDRIKKKAVAYEDVMQVIYRMTDEGGKFFDFQSKMADTLKVQLANLTLAWNNMLNDIGASHQGILSGGIGALKELFLHWKELNGILTTVAVTIGLVKAQQILANVAVGKGTISLVKYVAANKAAQWVEYKRALQTKELTLAQGAWLIMTNKNNVALAASLVRMKVLTAEQARFLLSMKGVSAGLFQFRLMATMAINGVIKSVKALGAAFARNLPIIALMGAIDMFTHFSTVAQESKSFNESIANGAKEASEALKNFMKEDDKVKARAQAKNGKLSAEEGRKVWNAIREQIEMSSQAADVFIPQLLSVKDINERITKAFNLAERIQEATSKLGELYDELDVSQDSWLWGLFGEGLGSDLDDYNKRIKELREQSKYFAEGELDWIKDFKIFVNGVWDGLGASRPEAIKEVEKFANEAADVIREKLGKEGSADKTQVTEAVSRFIKAAETQIPQIRGAAKNLFESVTNEIMGERFKEAYDKQEYYYKEFLENLKKDYGSKFGEVSDDIIDKTNVWNDAQKKAIEDTANKIKWTWPLAAREALDAIIADLNSRDFKLHMVATFGQDLDEFQKEFKARVDKLGITQEALNKYAPKSGQGLPAWTNAQREQIKALKEENDVYNKDNSEWAKRRKADNNTEIQQRTKALGLFKQSALTDKEAAKAQHKAESELQKALKEEITLLDKVRSVYKSLTKEGVSSTEALSIATSGYDKTLKSVNAVLSKYGLSELDLTKYAGVQNPKAVMDMLQEQLNQLVKSGVVKPEEIKDLEVKLKDLKVDSVTFSQKTLVDSLNNELGKLKDEYELAIDLDANPELGETFADVIGINKEELDKLPKDFESVVTKMQAILDEKLGSGVFDVKRNLNKKNLESWLTGYGYTADSQMAKELTSYVDYANKVRQDETNKQVDEWNKLLEKYAEYEYKRKQITDTYEREIAIAVKKNASDAIIKGIQNKRDQDLAKLDFDEFMKSPQWITATGDLASLSNKAIRGLIKTLEDYKKSAKNLSPKQIKQLNNALKNLYKEQRKGSPFKAISNMMEEARNKMKEYDEEIKKTEKEMNELGRIKVTDGLSDKQEERLKYLRKYWNELKKAQKEAGEIDAEHWVASINEVIGAVQGAISIFDGLAKAISGVNTSDVDKVFGVISKAGQGAAMGAQISNSGWGALVGGLVGAATGIIEWLSGSYNEKINGEIKKSEVAVKRLENTYKQLENTIEDAYGTAVIGAQQAAVENKKLQLVELKRQLALERSRDSKDRDESRIEELKGEIIDLERSIKEATDEIINNLLGISSVSDAIEEFMDSYIEAIRNGEDANKVFSQSINDMIANMVKKLISTKILGPWFESVWNTVQEEINARGKDSAEAYQNAKNKYDNAKIEGTPDGEDLVQALRMLGLSDDEISNLIWNGSERHSDWYERLYNRYLKEYAKSEKEMADSKKQLDADTSVTVEDIKHVAELLRTGQPIMDEKLKAIEELMNELGIMNDIETSGLSKLQQGISGITEDTAGALESYMNGVSQQVYYQSDLLTQIRDTILGFDLDIQMGVLSEILLQLQSSYQIQMSIRDTLQGWSNASGMAVRVEMI